MHEPAVMDVLQSIDEHVEVCPSYDLREASAVLDKIENLALSSKFHDDRLTASASLRRVESCFLAVLFILDNEGV